MRLMAHGKFNRFLLDFSFLASWQLPPRLTLGSQRTANVSAHLTRSLGKM